MIVLCTAIAYESEWKILDPYNAVTEVPATESPISSRTRKTGIPLKNLPKKRRMIVPQHFPPCHIPTSTPTICKVNGCRSPSGGRPFCRKHAQKGKDNAIIFSSEQRSHMRSVCCNAPCTAGPQHEYGNQYCKACKGPCCWHS